MFGICSSLQENGRVLRIPSTTYKITHFKMAYLKMMQQTEELWRESAGVQEKGCPYHFFPNIPNYHRDTLFSHESYSKINGLRVKFDSLLVSKSCYKI